MNIYLVYSGIKEESFKRIGYIATFRERVDAQKMLAHYLFKLFGKPYYPSYMNSFQIIDLSDNHIVVAYIIECSQ